MVKNYLAAMMLKDHLENMYNDLDKQRSKSALILDDEVFEDLLGAMHAAQHEIRRAKEVLEEEINNYYTKGARL